MPTHFDTPPLRILIVNESPPERDAIYAALAENLGPVELASAETEDELRGMLRANRYDIAISEHAGSWGDGGDVLLTVQGQSPATAVILVSGAGTVEGCARLMKSGLADFIEKSPGWLERLVLAVRTMADRQRRLGEIPLTDEEHRDELVLQHRELKAVNDTLVQQIDERRQVAERRARQLRVLAAELTKAEERERRRLAQMLHDDLQQMLVAARMHISAIMPQLASERVTEQIAHIDDLVERSIRLSRNLTHRASPPVLYDAGLAPALVWIGRQIAEEHGLQVEVDCDDDAEPESQDTRIFLYQACRELLLNVVKHAGCQRAKITMHRAGGDDVQVSVCDNGRGFEQDLSHEVKPGEGFGLFSIRERLQLIGGRMEIESLPGRGSCVRLFARIAAERKGEASPDEIHRSLVEALERTAAEGDPEEDMRVSEPPIRVLLADDHRIIRASLAGLLRKRPEIEVVGQAGDGRQTIEKARALRPDVIVMDVTMPVIDGLEATRTLVAEMPHLAVIALSMHEDEQMQRSMRAAGAVRYLTKDGPPELLIAAIRSTARARKPVQVVAGESPP